MIKAIIWDMDGVLVDSEKDHRNAEIATLREFGVKLSHEDIKAKYMGYKLKEYFEKIAEDFKLDLPIDEVVARHRAVLDHYYSEVFGVVPHAEEVLRDFREAGFLMALATSAVESSARHCLDRHGLTQFFDALTFGSDVVNGKPAPDIYLLAAKKIRVSSAECIVIEDAYNGFVGAKAAGMKVIGRRAAHNDTMDFGLADYVIEDLTDIEGIISSLR